MEQPRSVYQERVNALSHEERERLSSRMRSKLPKRLDKEEISIEAALAIQMELEDEQLEEWRRNVMALREKDSRK